MTSLSGLDASRLVSERCELLRQVHTDAGSNDEIETLLEGLIPKLGSTDESPQLRHLRALATSTASTSASPSTFTLGGSTSGRSVNDTDTELRWDGNTVIWMRNSRIIRAFTFEENVKTACWATLETVDDRTADYGGHASSSALELSATEPCGQKRTLCIFLISCLVLYQPHTGEEYIKRLDFEVQHVFALDVGLLLQRKAEVEDRRRSELISSGIGEGEAPLSTVFYLRRPNDELQAVDRKKAILFSRSSPPRKQHTAEAVDFALAKDQLQVFNDPDEVVVHVSVSPPVLVSVNHVTDRINLYAYAHGHQPLKDLEDFPHRTPHASNTMGEYFASNARVLQTDTSKRNRHAVDARVTSVPRPRLPSRKSARLESGGNRNSIGTSRASVGAERSRTSSATGHSRRYSGGMTALYNPNTSLQDDEHRADEEENLQEVMQLLDGFDEAEEEDATQAHARLAPQANRSSRQAPPTVPRRRASRANTTSMPSATQNTAPPLSQIATTLRTPYVKSRPVEERMASRSRPSRSVARDTDSSLSHHNQKTSSDFASQKGLQDEFHGGGAAAGETDYLSFHNYARGFFAVSLIEAIAVPRMQSVALTAGVKALFGWREDQTVWINIVLPYCSRIVSRCISEEGMPGTSDRFSLRSLAPDEDDHLKSMKVRRAISITTTAKGDDMLLVMSTSGKTGHLLLGPHRSDEDLVIKSSLLDSFFTDAHLSASACEVRHTLGYILEATDQDTIQLFAACRTVLGRDRYNYLRIQWMRRNPQTPTEEWTALCDLLVRSGAQSTTGATSGMSPWQWLQNSAVHGSKLASLAIRDGANTTREGPDTKQHTPWSVNEMADLASMVDMLTQEARLDVSRRKGALPRLASLASRTGARLNWPGWVDHYTRLVPEARTETLSGTTSSAEIAERRSFDVYTHLLSLRQGDTSTIRVDGYKGLLPRVSLMERLYKCLFGPGTFNARAKATVECILEHGMSEQEMANLPLSIASPLHAAILHCQADPPTSWGEQAYNFVKREDISKQTHRITKLKTPVPASASNPLPSSAGNSLFPRDYRVKEVAEMLQTSRPVATKGVEVGSTEEQDLIAEQQKRIFTSASDRIKALSVGRAIFSFSSLPLNSTEQLKTRPICLRIRMLSNCIIQHREPDPEGAEMEWPEFHNGTASAFQLSMDGDKIESSWLYSQLNREFNARHAGLIFGIGALGQLRSLGKVHAHFYLSNRHTLTTIALLLGISLSFLGSCDSLAKALMSIHLIHTLPTHSKPLKTSMLEQSAALVGLGFVFHASNDRWVSRMAFKALTTDHVMTDDDQMLKRECFSLSAAISLGLACLGQGRRDELSGEMKKDIIPGLEGLIRGFDPVTSSKRARGAEEVGSLHQEANEKQYSAFQWKPDISLSTTPASLALALVYLRSNRRDKQEKLPMPQTQAHLDIIRPDLLLMRVICRHLIGWSDIVGSCAWIDDSLPAFLRYKGVQQVRRASESCQLAYWNSRLGSIFAIGLKYAGSNDEDAGNCLMQELRLFQSQIDVRPASYSEKIRQQVLQSSADVILTCLAMIMAGTGNIAVLQQIRKSLYKVDNLRYGNYMARSMALGMLFLGGGRFTLARSDLAIASLLIAFFPRYPVNAQDNRMHLQAYRHLWMLAVEARLLNVEDVTTGKIDSVPLKLTYKGSNVPLQEGQPATTEATISTPCLVPRLQALQSIQLASDRYFERQLDLSCASGTGKRLLLGRTLYVKRKAGEKSHDADTTGRSSINAKLQGLAIGMRLPIIAKESLHPQEDASVDLRQDIVALRRMITDHMSDNHGVLKLVEVICCVKAEAIPIENGHASLEKRALMRKMSFEIFALQAILHCVQADKEDVLPHYLHLFASTSSILDRLEAGGDHLMSDDVLFLGDLRALHNMQRENSIDQSRVFLERVIPPELVEGLLGLLQDAVIALLESNEGHGILSGYFASVAVCVAGYKKDQSDTKPWLLSVILLVLDVPSWHLLQHSIEKVPQTPMDAQQKHQERSKIGQLWKESGHATHMKVIDLLIEAAVKARAS